MSPTPPEARIQAALADIWIRTLPVIQARVDAIDVAIAELAKPSPGPDLIDGGRAAAHQLSGVLGTFGLHRGTELARAIEERLESGNGDEPPRLAQQADELRSTVEGARVEDERA